MRKPLAIIGVPTSAGAFSPGQEKAPKALRDAGFIEQLSCAGIEVVDHGDGAVYRWRPDKANRFAQNLDAVIEIAKQTATRVQQAIVQGQIPLVIGGDCTIEMGTIMGQLSTEARIGLIYFDMHPDLNIPESAGSGTLDWMGMAHILGEEKAETALSHIGSRFPLLASDDVLFFSYGPDHLTDWERGVMERRRLRGIPVDEVASDPKGAAARVLTEMEQRFEHLLVHFDVDAIDFVDLPLSEERIRNEGLSFDQAMQALTAFVGSEKFSALTITELNPDHGEESGATIDVFVKALVRALAASPWLAKHKQN